VLSFQAVAGKSELGHSGRTITVLNGDQEDENC